MTVDEALVVWGPVTHLSDLSRILEAGYALAAEVRRLRGAVELAYREGYADGWPSGEPSTSCVDAAWEDFQLRCDEAAR